MQKYFAFSVKIFPIASSSFVLEVLWGSPMHPLALGENVKKLKTHLICGCSVLSHYHSFGRQNSISPENSAYLSNPWWQRGGTGENKNSQEGKLQDSGASHCFQPSTMQDTPLKKKG